MNIKKLHVVADGEANFYTVGDERNWFCRVHMNGELRAVHQEEFVRKMAAAVTVDTPPVFDRMTVAYIAFGFRGALAEGLVFDPDDFNGETGLMEALVNHAPALDAEFQRRYGEQGLDPDGQSFLFEYEIAEPFGHRCAEMLAADHCAEVAPLIQAIFDEADPDFWDRVKKAESGSTDDVPETAAAA